MPKARISSDQLLLPTPFAALLLLPPPLLRSAAVRATTLRAVARWRRSLQGIWPVARGSCTTSRTCRGIPQRSRSSRAISAPILPRLPLPAFLLAARDLSMLSRARARYRARSARIRSSRDREASTGPPSWLFWRV